MANVLTSFLVGIGFETDRQSEQQVSSSFDNIKSKALQLGSILAGTFGAYELTFGKAGELDALGKTAKQLGVAANDLLAAGNVFSKFGGSQAGMEGILKNLQKMASGLTVGEFEGLYNATTGILGNPGAMEAALRRGDMFGALDVLGGQLRMQDNVGAQNRLGEAFGLDPAGVQMLLAGSLRGGMEEQKALRNVTSEMTQTAADFNDAWQDFTQVIAGVTDQISVGVLEPLTDIIEGLTRTVQFFTGPLEDGPRVLADQSAAHATGVRGQGFDPQAMQNKIEIYLDGEKVKGVVQNVIERVFNVTQSETDDGE